MNCVNVLLAALEPCLAINFSLRSELFIRRSIVFFDGDEVVVGTDALRNSITNPERVVLHAKRFMGDPNKCWIFDGHVYRPKDISALIIRKLLDGAEERLEILTRFLPFARDCYEEALNTYKRKDVAADDILDAMVGAVTAMHLPGIKTLPENPGMDEEGLAMEIVYAVI